MSYENNICVPFEIGGFHNSKTQWRSQVFASGEPRGLGLKNS